jgi:hypothetical protein
VSLLRDSSREAAPSALTNHIDGFSSGVFSPTRRQPFFPSAASARGWYEQRLQRFRWHQLQSRPPIARGGDSKVRIYKANSVLNDAPKAPVKFNAFGPDFSGGAVVG